MKVNPLHSNKRITPTVVGDGRKRARGKFVFLVPALLALFFFAITSFHFLSSPALAGTNPSASAGVAFGPTVPNKQPAPRPAPNGMVWIPGGEFSMGAQDPPEMNMVGMQATTDSRPIHRVYVDGFFMDKTDVTNANSRRSSRLPAISPSRRRLRPRRTFPERHRKI